MKKILVICLTLALVFGCLAGCGTTPATQRPNVTNGDDKTTNAPTQSEEAGSLRWPKFGVCKLLPVPPSTEGYIHEDSSDEADIDVYGMTQNDFYQYVAECQEMGFVIDYYSDETDYEAYNEDDYCLWIDYDQETEVMNIWIYYDEDYDAENSEEETEEPTEAVTVAPTAEPTEEPTEAPTKEDTINGGLRKDFKEAMDNYETFMDEYVEFMKKYQKNPSDFTLLMEYAEVMADYVKFTEAFAEWADEDMNDAELAYYLEVQARVTKKLTEIA